jgi:hypothetical protein
LEEAFEELVHEMTEGMVAGMPGAEKRGTRH